MNSELIVCPRCYYQMVKGFYCLNCGYVDIDSPRKDKSEDSDKQNSR